MAFGKFKLLEMQKKYAKSRIINAIAAAITTSQHAHPSREVNRAIQ